MIKCILQVGLSYLIFYVSFTLISLNFHLMVLTSGGNGDGGGSGKSINNDDGGSGGYNGNMKSS